jgi:polyamine oxidase
MPCDRRKPGQRLQDGDVDLSLRSAYGLLGISPQTPQEVASDYYQIDFVSIAWLAH